MLPRLLISPGWLCAIEGNDDRRVPEEDERIYTLSRLRRACKVGILPTQEHKVRTICGSSIRKFTEVDVLIERQRKEVLADIVTGSLYDKITGQCLSGPLQIV